MSLSLWTQFLPGFFPAGFSFEIREAPCTQSGILSYSRTSPQLAGCYWLLRRQPCPASGKTSVLPYHQMSPGIQYKRKRWGVGGGQDNSSVVAQGTPHHQPAHFFFWARNPPSDMQTKLALRGSAHTPRKAKLGALTSKEPASPFTTVEIWTVVWDVCLFKCLYLIVPNDCFFISSNRTSAGS